MKLRRHDNTLTILLVILLIVTAGVVGYSMGQMTDSITYEEVDQYITAHDSGCNDIVAKDNKVVCEVDMQHEDDAVFIIKKAGAKDDWLSKGEL